jgi:uroporphyrinogen-III synthase
MRLSLDDFTDVIFQSIASVENFKNFEICTKKNIYSIGESTKKALSEKGIHSMIPKASGSSGLIKLIGKEIQKQRFIIIKGEDGLNDIEDYINEQGSHCENIICYKRKELDSYDLIKNKFNKADAVIFTSVYGAKIFFENLYEDDKNITFFCISKRIKEQIDLMGFEARIINYFSDNLYLEVKKAI